MQQLQWYFHRIRSMGLAEVIWRIRGLSVAAVDLTITQASLWPALPSNIVDFHSSRKGDFRVIPRCGTRFSAAAEGCGEEWGEKLTAKAELARSGRLSYLGLKNQYLGNPVSWMTDFCSGVTSGLKPSVLTDYRNNRIVGDCKLVWEPNRHHQSVVLARAFLVTGDEKFARSIIDQMLDWGRQNPPGRGMNWKSPMELGIRIINWTWALDAIWESGVADDSEAELILTTIYRMTWDIQRKYSKGSSANNHLIGEAAGVYIACAYFDRFPNCDKMRQASKEILEKEILAQTYEDGCTREHAFGYQLFVMQFFSLCLLVGRAAGDEFSQAYKERLQAIYRFIAELVEGTGLLPNIGDSDDGYVLDLGDLPGAPLNLIQVGAQIFDDSELQLAPVSETVCWMFADKAVAFEVTKRKPGSTAYTDSGYFFLRSDSGPGNTDARVSVLFDCAVLGFGPIAAHGHADCLSFVLNVGRENIFVDPGTYDYFSYPDWREYFRSTAAHNTLVVDGRNQSESLGAFMWGNRANARLLEWLEDNNIVRACGEHTGYMSLQDPVTHQRSIEVCKKSGKVTILDSLIANMPHDVVRHFHLASGCSIERTSNRSVTIRKAGETVYFSTTSGELEVVDANADDKCAWVSPSYHVRHPSISLIVRNRVAGADDLQVTISVSI